MEVNIRQIRDSNFELLRIISMFFIIVWHILIHGNVLTNTTGLLNNILNFIQCILVVHVNSFVLVTGYYQSKSKSNFNLKKTLKLFYDAWFYRVIIIIILLYFNLVTVSKFGLFTVINPISSTGYWFLNVYLVLYLISPFLNILINNLDKKKFEKLLIILFILFSILSSFTNQGLVNNNRGYSIYNFMFLYLIGAYFRLNETSIKENIMKKKINLKVLLIISFIFLAFLNFVIYLTSIKIIGGNEILSGIGQYLYMMLYSYDNPIVILQSIIYFMFFSTLVFKNKIVNKISTLVFGVYLIHDNEYLRTVLYKLVRIDKDFIITSYKIIPKVVVVGLSIYIVCIIVEFLKSKAENLFLEVFKKNKNNTLNTREKRL